jgi:hypothetical protein
MFGAGLIGQAFRLDGMDDFVRVSDHPDWTLGKGPFTIDLWVKFDEVPERAPFVSHDEGPGERRKWIFWFDALGHRAPWGPAIRFHVNSPTLGAIDTIVYPWQPDTDQWYHVAITRDAGSYSLYLNGRQAITEASSIYIPDANVALSIGESEGQYFFNGSIDEVEIFDQALSAPEIADIYTAGRTGECITP